MLNLDVIFLTNAIGCIHSIKPTTFGNVKINKPLRLQTWRSGFYYIHFIGEPLVIEEHKQVGHLISIFQMACFLALLKHHGWSTIPELSQHGSNFSAQVSLHSWANGFFFSGFTAWGIPLYISHLWCSGAWKPSSKIFDTIHIMIFLGQSVIFGAKYRGVSWSLQQHALSLFFWGCSLIVVPVLERCSKFITAGCGASSLCESFLYSPCELLGCSNKSFPKGCSIFNLTFAFWESGSRRLNVRW